MFDDTCYLTPCYSAEQASLLTSLLNAPACLEFVQSIAFRGSKRPITKKLLQRIDIKALLKHVERPTLLERAEIEFDNLQTSIGNEKPIWPSSLEELLVTSKQAV